MPSLAEIRQQYPQYSDMSDERLSYALHSAFYKDVPYKDFAKAIGYQNPNLKTVDPSEGSGTLQVGPIDTGVTTPQWLERGLAGAGKYFSDLGTGAAQRATEFVQASQGYGTPIRDVLNAGDRAAVAETRRLDAPLMKTMAGKVGNIGAGVVSAIPLMAIPGAATVPGAATIGGAQGALQPTLSDAETLRDTGIGAGLSAAGQYVGNRVGNYVQDRLAERAANAAQAESQNSVRDAILQQARDAGYVIPPTDVNPSITNTALESISGKAATRQVAQATNQRVTNGLVKADLGLAVDAPITRGALGVVRARAGQVYGQVSQLGAIPSDQAYQQALQRILQTGSDLEAAYPGIGAQASQEVAQLVQSADVATHNAADAVQLSRFLRNQASQNFKSAFSRGGDPQAQVLAQAQSQVAGAVEDLIARHLQSTGNSALFDAWNAARTTIAKSWQAQAALKGGNISAVKLAAQLEKSRPVTGGMGRAAQFAEYFGDAAKLPKGGAGVSKLAATVGGGSALTSLALGHPGLAVTSLAASATPWAVRRGLLSGVGQSVLATPNYAPNLLGTGALESLQFLSPYTAPLLTRMGLLAQPDEQQPF